MCIPHLSNSSNVLLTVFGRETEVLVQTESHIVAVESVCRKTKFEEVLLKGSRNGRFARRRKAGKPDSASFLFAKLAALCAREAGVPGDVAVLCQVYITIDLIQKFTYVAIVVAVECTGLYV